MVRASVAEYLTFVTATGESNIQSLYADENVWLSQKMMGLLYDVDVRTINYHLQKIFSDNELDEKSVIQDFRITADNFANGQRRLFKNLPLRALRWTMSG